MYAANPRAIDATTQFGVARVDNTQPAEVVALRSQLWYLAKKDLEAVQREEVSEPCSTQILKIGATERGGGGAWRLVPWRAGVRDSGYPVKRVDDGATETEGERDDEKQEKAAPREQEHH